MLVSMPGGGPASLGGLIHDLRMVLGYSQSRLADAMVRAGHADTVTGQTIYRWESGRRSPRPYSLKYLAVALDVPLAVLEDADVDRRRFLTAVAGTAIAPVAAAELIQTGFSAALSGAPAVDEWLDTLSRYGHDYMSLGAAEIQRRLATDLVLLPQQLGDRGLWNVAARLMTLYGKTIPGADGTKAVHWYRMAAAAADRSDDEDTRVWVRGRATIALGYEGASLRVADTFAREALAISDRPSLGRLNAVMGRAHSAAIRGDDMTARRMLNEGGESSTRSDRPSRLRTTPYPNGAWACSPRYWPRGSAMNRRRWRRRAPPNRTCQSRYPGSARIWSCIAA